MKKKKPTEFDFWWDSLGTRWLNVTEQHKEMAKAAWEKAWDLQQDKIEDIYAEIHCNDGWHN